MKARIEKKLSKRVVMMAPTVFKDAWIDDERSYLAERQKTSVSHIYSVGGGVDYFGDGNDWATAWQHILSNWPWMGNFPAYPSGHESEFFPNIGKFNPTTKNILNILADYELKLSEKVAARNRSISAFIV